MSRPRLPDNQVSRWAHWKRNQRAQPGGKVGKDAQGRQLAIDHKDNDQSNNSPSNLQKLTLNDHAAKTNKDRARRSAIKKRLSR